MRARVRIMRVTYKPSNIYSRNIVYLAFIELVAYAINELNVSIVLFIFRFHEHLQITNGLFYFLAFSCQQQDRYGFKLG